MVGVATEKNVYDPHVLYHAINITVELEYKVPMQKIYDILAIVDAKNSKALMKIKPEDVLELIQLLGSSLNDNIMTSDSSNCDSSNLQAKIKEILRLLGCDLSVQDLNKILRGELSLDDALSKKAKLAWLIVFDVDENGRSRPNKEVVDLLLLSSQAFALETIELNIQRLAIDKDLEKKQNRSAVLSKHDRGVRSNKEKEFDPLVLEKKRNKLRLYIAHMQGYDKDRDRDGGRGVDPTTGIIIDFNDIYIADKQGATLDISKDEIDRSDIH